MPIEIKGQEEIDSNLRSLKRDLFDIDLPQEMENLAREIAKDLRSTYTGKPGPGFQDRTGALRASITGGLEEVTQTHIKAFVGAGDDNIGSNNRPTREYVQLIEFPEFRRFAKTDTSFLRPGVLMNGLVHKKITSELKSFFENKLKR